MQQLRAQAAAYPTCIYAQNLVAAAIRDEIRAYDNDALEYVVLVGGDSSIPFFRYPDLADLAPESWYVPPVMSNTPSDASLRSDYILGQDEYGAEFVLSTNGFTYPVPDLRVGRVVETAAEASNMIDAYSELNGQPISPSTSLVTGYEFIADSAESVQARHRGRNRGAVRRTHREARVDDVPWTADELRSYILDPAKQYDLVYLAGHFDGNSLLAADLKTTISASELLDPAVDLRNSLVWSTGCHAGYGIVDTDGIAAVTQTLDWAQTMARKGATFVAGTAFQYGDDELVEYSERIYAEFAHQLRVEAGVDGTDAVDVGSALVKSKLAYLASTPDISNLHRKALITASLFGLPMFSVDMPGERAEASATTAIVNDPGANQSVNYTGIDITAGLDSTDLGTTLEQADLDEDGTPDASYYSGSDGVSSEPGEAVLPRTVVNATVDGKVLRGVGFLGGAYDEQVGVTPLVGAAGTESGGAQTPLTSTSFTPARLWSASHFGELSGGTGTNLIVTPAQHRVESPGDPTAIRRVYSTVDLQLFYADPSDPVFVLPPSILGVSAVNVGGIVTFSMHVDGAPQAPTEAVWVTYTFGAGPDGGAGSWTSLPLTQSTQDPTLWVADLPLPGGVVPADIRYIVQAVNTPGVVAYEDNGGPYFTLTGPTTSLPSTVALAVGNPDSGAHDASVTLSATLSCSECASLANKSVSFQVGSTTRAAVTDASGTAEIPQFPLGALPGDYTLTATFAGDGEAAASSASAPFTVTRIPTALELTLPLPPASVKPGLDSGVLATLTDTSGATPIPMPSRSVTFVVWDGATGGEGYSKSSTTGPDGTAALGALPSLPNGEYQIYAYFSGSYPGNPWAEPPTIITIDDPIYVESSDQTPPGPGLIVERDPQTITFGAVPAQTYGDDPFTVTASATSGLPVSFSTATTTVCTVNGSTVTIIGAGDCVIDASVAGNLQYDSATDDETFTIAKKALSVNAVAASKTYGAADPAFTWTYSGFVPGDSAANVTISGAAACSRTLGETVAGSPYTITCGPGSLGSANYSFVTGTTASFTIATKALSVNAVAASKTYGAADPAFTWTYSGFVPGDSAANVTISGAAACSRTLGETVAGSPYTITCGPGVPRVRQLQLRHRHHRQLHDRPGIRPDRVHGRLVRADGHGAVVPHRRAAGRRTGRQPGHQG